MLAGHPTTSRRAGNTAFVLGTSGAFGRTLLTMYGRPSYRLFTHEGDVMSNRMASWLGLAATVTVLGGAGQVAAQQQVKLSEGSTLTISGFINASFYNNRGLFDGFGQGQNAEWASVVPIPQDQGSMDGDIRNTRIRFDFAGSPMFGNVPVSVTHIAFPLGYGATGMVGWRFPGIFLYHDLTPGKPLAIQVQVAVMKGSGPPATVGIGTGEASGVPQFETRFNLAKKLGSASWSGYVVFHEDNKDVNGIGIKGGDMNGWGFETGHAITSGKITVHGNYYTGHNLGQQFAHITQGSGAPATAVQGRIQGWGAWAQAGYDFTSHWSFWFYFRMQQPNATKYGQDNGVSLPRQLSHDTDALIRFRAGRYAAGLEYFRAITRWNVGVRTADQYAISVLYTI